MGCRIPFHDGIGAIGRSIIYDHPLDRAHRLRRNGLESQFNKICLVSRRRYQSVAEKVFHEYRLMIASKAGGSHPTCIIVSGSAPPGYNSIWPQDRKLTRSEERRV